MGKLQEFKRRNTRRCSIVQVGGFRPTLDPLASHFGLTPMGSPGDAWPSADGRPMIFVCQLNLTSAPFVPPLLEDVKLITFFIRSEDGVGEARENGIDWRLCAFHSLDGLAPLAPAGAKRRKGLECTWAAADDHPNYDDPAREAVEGFDDSSVELENVARTKIGGYVTTVQAEPWWDLEDHPAKPAYCLQIASEEKAGLQFGDGGIVYLARGTADGFRDRWFLDWQCY
jgi:uncharacterized protein YwqG